MIGLACFAAWLSPLSASAETVLVDSKSTGGFGSFTGDISAGGSDFVFGWAFTAAGESLTGSATGVINLSNALPNNGPNGIPVTIDGFVVSTGSYNPLEQAAVEAGTLTIPRPIGTVLEDVGALIAAFVPDSLWNQPGFVPRADSTTGAGQVGIPARSLFLLGDSFTFVAPEAGRLYFGINDLFPGNNVNVTTGGFTVTFQTAAVPEPSSIALLAVGGIAVLSRVLRRKVA